MLTAGTGITIQDNVISATGGGGTTSLYNTLQASDTIAIREIVKDSTHGTTLTTTFSLMCGGSAECVIDGELKEALELFINQGVSISNGALTISNEDTSMNLLNSVSSENVKQFATFTFIGGGGGGGATPY